MNAPTTITELRRPPNQLAQPEPDYAVDLFSVRGLKLALKLGEYLMESDAVPTMFRRVNQKKAGNGDIVWVENPSAMGNLLVAIETARAVGMSITSVMQNANIIEGKLSWSAQFWIAAINASGRFTPLRFDIVNRGRIKAKYREKQGWNKQKRGFDFLEREVDVDDLACIAWALPHGFVTPKGIYTLQQARDAKLPVIESSPVSMRMAVEEGWYAKPGSKWQTEMRHQMLQYRAGAFFGRIHAPDIVMGMGRTTEELIDTPTTTVDVAPDGTVTAVTTEDLRRPADAPPAPAAVVVQAAHSDEGHGEDGDAPAAGDDNGPAGDAPTSETKPVTGAPSFDANAFAERLEACTSVDALDVMADELRGLKDADAVATLTDVYKRRRAQLEQAGATDSKPARRSRSVQAPE
jgi:hypothetical protein